MIVEAYWKYFQRGQKVLVRRVGDDGPVPPESIAARLAAVSQERFDLQVARSDVAAADFALPAGAGCELVTVFAGLGLKVAGSVAYGTAGALAFFPDGGMEMFFRREHLRLDLELSCGVLRQHQVNADLRTFWRNRWLDPSGVEGQLLDTLVTPVRQEVNLGGGGMRIRLEPPPRQGELCLVRIDLEDRGGLLDVLASVVWKQAPQGARRRAVGVRFVGLRNEQRGRIERYVAIRYWKAQQPPAGID